MNMTEKFLHDQNDYTDKHERWNLTKKGIFYKTYFFQSTDLFFLSRCYYQILDLSDVEFLM